MKKGQTSKRGGYQDLLCPFTTVYVTQWSDTGTHRGSKAYDVRGAEPGGRYPYYAPCDVICVKTYPSYGEAIWQSVNKVRFANGKIDYFTFTTVHDNSFNVKAGSKVYKQGTQLGNMGNKPSNICTGVHCHIEGCYGKTNTLTRNKYGIYILRSFDAEVLPRDTFFMDGTVIKKWYKPKYLKDVPVATPTTSKKYYAKYTGKSSSLVEALNAIGADSSFNNRKAIAKANNINGYIGSSSQNIKMLNLLKQGLLIKRP